MHYCENCGMPAEDDDVFCVRCGRRLKVEKRQGSLDADEQSGKAAPAPDHQRIKPKRTVYWRDEPGGMNRRRPEPDPEQDRGRRLFIILLLLLFACSAVLGAVLFNRHVQKSESMEAGEEAEYVASGEEAERQSDEEEARQQAEEEARQQAEEEARRKAEEEAARKAEEEAARKEAEEEARRKAEEEAARKEAEEEAKRQAAEEEARKKAEEEAEKKAAAATDSSYILPESSSRYYSEEELRRLDDYTLQMAINEIYARHGRKFDTDSIRAYFESKTWYKGTISPSDFDGNESKYFNQYEMKNRELMAKIREERTAASSTNRP